MKAIYTIEKGALGKCGLLGGMFTQRRKAIREATKYWKTLNDKEERLCVMKNGEPWDTIPIKHPDTMVV